MGKQKWSDPKLVWEQYRNGANYKSGLGQRGLYDQSRVNERFYSGDQWHGARTGDRPLVRYNVVKRIGDYKMAMVGGANIAVNYTAEGVPSTLDIRQAAEEQRKAMKKQIGYPMAIDPTDTANTPLTAVDINLVTQAMTDYFRTTAERVKLDDLKNSALRKAYITGTGILYTYWDERVETGLYADEGRTSPIRGDIRCEVLDVENVYFGDPSRDSVQEQPYILIVQRRRLDEVQREARRNRQDPDSIKPDEDTSYMAGDRSDEKLQDDKQVTVITKLYKEWSDDGERYRILAVRTTEGGTVRAAWDTKLQLYPLAKMNWETRANCAYGDSEITHLIPNQIAINRGVTASVWAMMMLGMPITVVNGDVIQEPVTNEPGQVIRVYGGTAKDAITTVTPPNFNPQFENMISSLISNTLTQSGANDAALGDIRPDNTSAIMAVREAATMPMQLLQNRFYSFLEDLGRIWADFWVNMYGKRALKIEDEDGDWYMPFDGERYRNVLMNVKIDVGQAGLWSEIQAQQTLDNMLANQLITPMQYLERLPKNGAIPNVTGLIEDLKNQQAAKQPSPQGAGGGAPEEVPPMPQDGGMDLEAAIASLPPEYQQALANMSPEQRKAVLAQMQGQVG